MKKKCTLPFLAFIASTSLVVLHGQTTHEIITIGNTFSPSTLTIQAGDSVRWVNSGRWALYPNTSLSNNAAFGFSAGDQYLSDNSTYLGVEAYPSAAGFTNCMGLGRSARPTGSNRVHIGNASITAICGQVGFTTCSDGRFKKNVSEKVGGLDFILRLRPVTYNMDVQGIAAALKEDWGRNEQGNIVQKSPDEATRRSREEKSQIRYTGFIAQEVEAAAKQVGFDFSGVDAPQNETGLYGLRYSEFVVPLVKGMQEQQVEIGNLKLEIEAQQVRIEKVERLESENAALKSQLDKITAALTGAGIAVEK
ncbi:MAG: tail fiber domain-containing protein [Bacteroidota bacterium]